jgi:hypothetical protein
MRGQSTLVDKFLAASAIVVAVAVVLRWIRSYTTSDQFEFERTAASSSSSMTGGVGTLSGKFVFELETVRFSGVPAAQIKDGFQWSFDHTPNSDGFSIPQGAHHLLGFGFLYNSGPQNFVGIQSQLREVGAWIPLWFLMPVCLAIAARSIYRLRRPQAQTGHCRRCGYDLRATPDRCPECGMESRFTKPV